MTTEPRAITDWAHIAVRKGDWTGDSGACLYVSLHANSEATLRKVHEAICDAHEWEDEFRDLESEIHRGYDGSVWALIQLNPCVVWNLFEVWSEDPVLAAELTDDDDINVAVLFPVFDGDAEKLLRGAMVVRKAEEPVALAA